MWVKYKYNFAYGSHRWEYLEIPDDWKDEVSVEDLHDEDRALGEYINDVYSLHERYNYSDKYRGFDYELLDGFPPFEVLTKRLKSAKRNAEHYADEVKRFQEMVDIAGTITKEDFSV